MTKLKPKVKQKKKATAVKYSEPAEEAPAAAAQSLFSIGDTVHHPMFGDGKVKSIDKDKLTIKFEGNVTKEIREDFVTRKQ